MEGTAGVRGRGERKREGGKGMRKRVRGSEREGGRKRERGRERERGKEEGGKHTHYLNLCLRYMIS